MSRFMRLFVFFDLPVKDPRDRKAYTRFHRFLVKDGYDMIQFSVYARICGSPEMIWKHIARLQANQPAKGSVRFMQITEKQFTAIQVLVGRKKRVEKPDAANQLMLF
jgi:CRISPR-associated protein Cas2